MRAEAAIAVVAVAVAAFAVGRSSSHSDTPAGQAPATARVASATTASATTAAAEPISPSSDKLEAPQFWQLMQDTRSASDNDTGRQSQLLQERLSKLSPQAIVDFAHRREQLDRGAYTYKMWGAAYVIEDGCSDDCFRDFRAYVISLGRDAYEKALANPDSLASIAQDAETGDWENADNVAGDAYSSRTGNDFPLDDSDLSGAPSGTPINLDDEGDLVRRYPQLAARFR
jgi:hypothetical protein